MKEVAGIVYLLGAIGIANGLELLYGKAAQFIFLGIACLVLSGIILFIYIAEQQAPAGVCGCDECREEEERLD